ncbi:MAG: hypothetical protein Q7J31_12200 [Syntrophales bacterium]|nr:hypothetical protein [Syntrophales bacterium]
MDYSTQGFQLKHERREKSELDNRLNERIGDLNSLNSFGCPVVALFDEEVNSLIMINRKEETVTYIMAVGR